MKLILILTLSFTVSAKENLTQKWMELNRLNSFELKKQSFCFKNKDNIITGNNINKQIRPASVSKLFTTLWALEKLGKNYRFKTSFIIKDETIYIKGSNDPFFVTENLLVVMGELASKGLFKRVVFDQNFYLNWSDNKDIIKRSLKKIVNSNLWDNYFNEILSSLDIYIKEYDLPYVLPSFFEISDIEYVNNLDIRDEKSELSHLSSPLYMHLKQVNIYSNNFYADQIFNYLGGESSFHKYLYEKFNVNSKDTHFYTGSGLGENRTTCSTTLKVLESLKRFTLTNELSLKDIISVAGSDSGTLKDRFKEDMSHKVLAKTGTLRHTSTLAGYLGKEQTHQFAVFNHTYKTSRARKMQNKFIKFYSDINATTKFSYQAINYLSILNTIIK